MKARRYLVSLFCALACIVFGIYASGGTLLVYVDIPSVLCVVCVTVAMLRSGYGFREMGAAFAAALSSRAEAPALERAELFFAQMRRYLYVSGILSTFLGFIAMFRLFKDPERFMPNLAVALIVVFYALLLDLAVALPLGHMAKRALAEAK
jgi:flagellar motor component MotA